MKSFLSAKQWKSAVSAVALGAIGSITVVGLAQNAVPVPPPAAAPPTTAPATTAPATTAPPTFGVPRPATQPGAAPAASTARPCVLPAQGLVSWLPGEDKVEDVFANKVAPNEKLAYAPGKVGQAFDLRGTSLRIPASPRLDVGTGAGFTWEAWVNPADVLPRHPILDFNNGEAYGVHLWIFSLQNAPGTLFANFQDTSGTAHIVTSQPGTLKAGEWQHIAITYDKKTGVGAIYINGLPAGQGNVGQFRPQTTYDMIIGTRPGGVGKGMLYTGQIDEISLYNRALTGNELRAIFQAGAAGKCNPQNVQAVAPPAAAKAEPTPTPVPTPTPLPTPTPTMIPAAKISQPLAAFTFATAEGVDTSIAPRIVDALTAELRKANYQIKPRQHLDKVFETLVADYDKKHTGAEATPGTSSDVLAPAVRDASLRRRASQQMEANTILWGEVQQFATVKGQPPRLKLVVRLIDVKTGTMLPEVVISEGLAENFDPAALEKTTEELVRRAVTAATARLTPLITQ